MVDQFLPLFPQSVADSYLYYFSLLQKSGEEIKAKVQETAVERTDEGGKTVLDYPYYSIHFTLDGNDVAESITIKDINPSAAGWEELKEKAIAVSEDEQSYCFVMGNYKIFVDLAKEEVTFTEVE